MNDIFTKKNFIPTLLLSSNTVHTRVFQQAETKNRYGGTISIKNDIEPPTAHSDSDVTVK